MGILNWLLNLAVMLPLKHLYSVEQEHLRKKGISVLLYKQKWALCSVLHVKLGQKHAFLSAGSSWIDVLWDHFKQPCHLLCFNSYLNCLLHHRWKSWSDLPAAAKASLKWVKFAMIQKQKKLLSIFLAVFEWGRCHAVSVCAQTLFS